MAKIRDVASVGAKEKRTRKLGAYGINCYLSEGLSQKFLDELEKFSTSIYYRYGIKEDLDYWLDESRDRILDRLPTYDPSKGAFVPWVFSRLRDKATNISRSGAKKLNDTDGDLMGGLEGRKYITDETGVWDFCKLGKERGLLWDAEALLADVQEGMWSPMIQVAAWLKLKGAY
jgi:hypothetical protein